MVNGNTRRSKSVSDIEVQGGLLFRMGGQWMLFLAANGIGLVAWVRMFEIPDGDWSTVFQEAFYRFLPVVIVSLCMLPAFIWDMSRVTNRFAGPVRRFRAALSEAVNGKTPEPLHFRTSDYWEDLASDFNKLVSRLPSSRKDHA